MSLGKMRRASFVLLLSAIVGCSNSESSSTDYIITSVNQDRVNVRNYPSVESSLSEVIGQVNKVQQVRIVGISKDKSKVGNFEAYWFEIRTIAESGTSDQVGWVFGEFLDDVGDIYPMTFTYLAHEKPHPGIINTLKLKAFDGKDTKTFDVQAMESQGTGFDSFGTLGVRFGSNVVPGVYFWNRETNSIEHLAYTHGDRFMQAWASYDLKYIFQDFGTAPGPRGMTVLDVATRRVLYEGLYYKGLDYQDDTISTVMVYLHPITEDAKPYGEVDAETLTLATTFLETTPYQASDFGGIEPMGYLEIIVRYRFYLTTGRREYLGCEYYPYY